RERRLQPPHVPRELANADCNRPTFPASSRTPIATALLSPRARERRLQPPPGRSASGSLAGTHVARKKERERLARRHTRHPQEGARAARSLAPTSILTLLRRANGTAPPESDVRACGRAAHTPSCLRLLTHES